MDSASTGQMMDSLEVFAVFSRGTTISVIATARHCRIRNATTTPRKAIKPKITRCGSDEPRINSN